jgi:phosphatidate cytidylyltransferase
MQTDRWVVAVWLIIGAAFLWYINSFFLTWAVLGGIYLLAFYEASKLFEVENNTLFFYAVLLWVISYFYPYGENVFLLSAVIFAGAVAYTQTIEWKNFLPFLYPSAGMLFMLSIYQNYEMRGLGWLIVVVALTDSAAYIVGKSIGKHKFSKTSPNKTWEGVAGGVVVATFGGTLAGLALMDVTRAAIISFCVAVASVFGDLFESYLKRRADVKDSGSILPGHGGVLDRMDGYLFGAVVMLVLLRGLV